MTNPANRISDEIAERFRLAYAPKRGWPSEEREQVRAALEAVADDVHAAVEQDIRERLANDPAAGWPC